MNRRTSSAAQLGAIAIGTASLLLSTLLAGCGGGGDGGNADVNAIGWPDSAAEPAGCPWQQASDVWVDNRLGCLSVGQVFLERAAGYEGARADWPVTVSQVAYDLSLDSVIKPYAARYFDGFVCIRNMPDSTLALERVRYDLNTVFGLTQPISGRLPGIHSSVLSTSKGRLNSSSSGPCDPARHPVIVDYDTRQVLSINPEAIKQLVIYDQ